MDRFPSRIVIGILTITLLLALPACNPARPAATAPAPLATLTSTVLTQAGETPIPASPLPPAASPTIEPPTSDNSRVSPTGCLVTLDEATSSDAAVEMGPAPGLPASEAPGEELVIVGTIFDRDCNPLPGASFNAWQTDPQGVYGPGHGSESIECCYYQGSGVTDENGRYKLVTVIPGHYAGEVPAPPAHIHIEISHPQAGGLMAEIVFAGDPSLQGMSQAGYTVVTLEDVGDPDTKTAYKRGFADIRLPGVSGAAPPSASGSRRSFQIDPKRSQAAYHIREKFARLPIQVGAVGVSSLVEGDIEIDLDDPQVLRSMRVQVDLRQLRSDKSSRDEKLLDDWLEINRFPHASFTATRLEGFPSGFVGDGEVSFTLWGDLTIRDVTRQVAFDVDALLLGDTLTGVAIARLKMTEFGIEPPTLLDFVVVEDEFDLTINIAAVGTGT